MANDQEMELSKLAGLAHDAKVYFDALGMQNTAHLSADERRTQSIKYELARAAMIETQAKVDGAMAFIKEGTMTGYDRPEPQYRDLPAEIARHASITTASNTDQAKLALAEHRAKMDAITIGWLLFANLESNRKTGLAIIGLPHDATKLFDEHLRSMHDSAINLANNIRDLYRVERVEVLIPSTKPQEPSDADRTAPKD